MVRSELTSNDSIELSDKKRLIMERESSKQKNSKKNNQMVNKGSVAYMSRQENKDFNKKLERKIYNSCGVGRPYAFQSLEQLESDMSEYFDACREYGVMPTNVTLALWLGVDEDTITNHANNPNSPFFGVMKKTKTYLHSLMQNGTLSGDINPVAYIFLAKNYYGMKDDKNIQVSAQQGSNVNTQETADALRKQIEEENTPNATLVSEE